MFLNNRIQGVVHNLLLSNELSFSFGYWIFFNVVYSFAFYHSFILWTWHDFSCVSFIIVSISSSMTHFQLFPFSLPVLYSLEFFRLFFILWNFFDYCYCILSIFYLFRFSNIHFRYSLSLYIFFELSTML